MSVWLLPVANGLTASLSNVGQDSVVVYKVVLAKTNVLIRTIMSVSPFTVVFLRTK